MTLHSYVVRTPPPFQKYGDGPVTRVQQALQQTQNILYNIYDGPTSITLGRWTDVVQMLYKYFVFAELSDFVN